MLNLHKAELDNCILHLDKRKNITGTPNPKRSKWWAVIRYYDYSGKRVVKWFDTQLPQKGNKRKAVEYTEQIIDYLTDRSRQKDNAITQGTLLTEYMSNWLNLKSGTIEQSTLEKYEIIIHTHLIPFFEKKKLCIQNVKPIHIREYYYYKAEKGLLDGKKGGLAHSNLRGHASVLNLIFQDAVIMEETTSNPMASTPLQKSVSEKNKTKHSSANFLSLEEANKLLEIFQHDIIFPCVLIALYYGLRRSEIVGLRWRAIDFVNDTIRIEHTVVKNKTIVAKDRTKSDESAAVFQLLPEIKSLLLEVKQKQDENKRLFGKQYEKSDYCFTWENGSLFRPDYLYRHFVKELVKNGLPKMRFHNLRHSCASILFDKGWNVKDIQEWLRHADIETTMNIYTHLTNERKQILAKNLENTFTLPA